MNKESQSYKRHLHAIGDFISKLINKLIKTFNDRKLNYYCFQLLIVSRNMNGST